MNGIKFKLMLKYVNQKSLFRREAYTIGTYSLYISGIICDTIYKLNIVDKNCIFNNAIKEITVLTPNGDGINDVLKFTTDAIIENSELFIYNRWGVRIYHKKNFTNDWNADGYPGGSYFYIFKNGEQEIKKNLTVIK